MKLCIKKPSMNTVIKYRKGTDVYNLSPKIEKCQINKNLLNIGYWYTDIVNNILLKKKIKV